MYLLLHPKNIILIWTVDKKSANVIKSYFIFTIGRIRVWRKKAMHEVRHAHGRREASRRCDAVHHLLKKGGCSLLLAVILCRAAGFVMAPFFGPGVVTRRPLPRAKLHAGATSSSLTNCKGIQVIPPTWNLLGIFFLKFFGCLFLRLWGSVVTLRFCCASSGDHLGLSWACWDRSYYSMHNAICPHSTLFFSGCLSFWLGAGFDVELLKIIARARVN